MSSVDRNPSAFIDRWGPSGGAERSNSQSFLSELCDLLDVPRPDPAVEHERENAYVFERSVTFDNGDGSTSKGWIDLYKAGCFVLESKQGSARREAAGLVPKSGPTKAGTAKRETGGWDQAMIRAKSQAENYIRALPADEGRPPFLLVVDVGHTIALYSEFTCTGGVYVPFPDPQHHRIKLDDLVHPEVRETLRAIWLDPAALDPSRRTAKVTREIAERLAKVARSLEGHGHDPEAVATFLMRCLFTMFAEDVGLLPNRGFTELLTSLRENPATAKLMIEDLWRAMKRGGFSVALREQIKHFNGVLFEEAVAIDVDADQLALLIEAGRADWSQVEPAIFGTLLERALSPRERHKLGAHYTPRAYVERLVLPTVVEPLREDWDNALAAATLLAAEGKEPEAIAELRRFHAALCQVRVLDPACGSGNFLYVTLEHLKRLEAEVLEAVRELGYTQLGLEFAEGTVGPHQLLGLEVNPRAAHIAELVLWIGYLQWHLRTQGEASLPEPIIGKSHNIECRDAVLAWDSKRPVLADGQPVTRWDGHSTKKHPVTGEDVPDETQRVLVEEYVNPRPAEWPEADFVVGNPPFIGKSRRRDALGHAYLEAIFAAYPQLPDGIDFVMYWWAKAAQLVQLGRVKQFGFITTSSISQALNRRVIGDLVASDAAHAISFAIPNHPWVDSASGAAVRIALTVVGPKDGAQGARLLQVTAEAAGSAEEIRVELSEQRVQRIHPDLSGGANLDVARPLQANGGIAHVGLVLFGKGFILGEHEVESVESEVRHPFLIARDLTQRSRRTWVVDLYPLDEMSARNRYPRAFQRLLDHVRPEREQIRDPGSRQRWWRFGRDKPDLRDAIATVDRYIATPEVSKHSLFVFVDSEVRPDHKLIIMATSDAIVLAVLSSRVHRVWSRASGGRHGVGNDPVYNKSRCFDPFPFPDPPDALKQRIRDLGEQLDAHRKARQAAHPELTLTGMYNVLEKLRAGEPLAAKDQAIHEQGLVSVLKQIHDDLDAAVFEAYGWPAGLSDDELLQRLVDLNAERAAEEQQGLIRWLRPEFQNPGGQGATQLGIEVDEPQKAVSPAELRPWPDRLPDQFGAVHAVLETLGEPADPETVARRFTGRLTPKRRQSIGEVLETLANVGRVRRVGEGEFVAR